MTSIKLDNSRKWVLGVSSGLSRVLKINKYLIRLFFILSTILLGGFGLLLYVILWICMFSKECEHPKVLGVMSYISKRNSFDVFWCRFLFSVISLITGMVPGIVLYLFAGMLIRLKLLKIN